MTTENHSRPLDESAASIALRATLDAFATRDALRARDALAAGRVALDALRDALRDSETIVRDAINASTEVKK
jgi:hypothetical protein